MHPTTSNKRKNDQNPTNPQKCVKPDVKSGQVVDAAVAAAPSPAPSSPAPSIIVVTPRRCLTILAVLKKKTTPCTIVGALSVNQAFEPTYAALAGVPEGAEAFGHVEHSDGQRGPPFAIDASRRKAVPCIAFYVRILGFGLPSEKPLAAAGPMFAAATTHVVSIVVNVRGLSMQL
ncbi:hypothetical protein H4582DRAFT_2063407 [Lactarius indigo]|nr:hypothetical protein H4582DRAFT_2063407 [Lactarius indigo]